MAGEWRELTIGALCDDGIAELQTGPFGTQLHAYDYVPEGIPVVPTEAIRDRRVDHSVLPKISSAKAGELARHRLRPGDILFARRGVQATGHIGCIREAEDGFICGTGAIRLRINHDRAEVEADFLSHVLANPSSIEWFKFHAIGATMPNLNEGIIRSFPLQIPPLPEQRAIAHILGTLDDKIELNRQMNETLEAMARALFKSWFIDFDPVRAKAAGRDQGLPKPLADLFPARLVDSELGEIPEGWEVQRVGDIGTIVCGKTPHTQVCEYYGHDLPFITIPDMHGRIFATSVQRRLSQVGAQSQEKKMLPVGAICVSCIGTAGLVVITSELSQTNQQINSVIPNQKDATYFWYWTLRNLGDDIRAGGSGGSVLTNLSTGRFSELRLLASAARLRSCYHMIVAPLFRRILENEHESSSLATLRDTLLPKLISGELRVKDAQRFTKRAI